MLVFWGVFEGKHLSHLFKTRWKENANLNHLKGQVTCRMINCCSNQSIKNFQRQSCHTPYTNISHKLRDVHLTSDSLYLFVTRCCRNIRIQNQKEKRHDIPGDILGSLAYKSHISFNVCCCWDHLAHIRDQFDGSAPPSTPAVGFQHTNPATSVAGCGRQLW